MNYDKTLKIIDLALKYFRILLIIITSPIWVPFWLMSRFIRFISDINNYPETPKERNKRHIETTVWTFYEYYQGDFM